MKFEVLSVPVFSLRRIAATNRSRSSPGNPNSATFIPEGLVGAAQRARPEVVEQTAEAAPDLLLALGRSGQSGDH